MKKIAFLFILLVSSLITCAQNVSINNTGTQPDASAILDISSSNKGLLIPRITKVQRLNIVNPKNGLMVYDSTSSSFWFYQKNKWEEIAGRTINTDSSLIIGQQTGTIPSYNLVAGNNYSADSSGYLYDSGGPAGNYGNNQDYFFQYSQGFSNAIAVKIQVISNDLENPYDSLFIFCAGFAPLSYALTGTQTGTYIFHTGPDIYIRFKSNSVNTAPGFKIRWDVIFPPAPAAAIVPPLSGWYFAPEKMAMHGGLNQNGKWSVDSSGLFSFNYGFGNSAKGMHSVAIGNNLKSSGLSSLATGWGTSATGAGSSAFGVKTTASDNYAFASGYFSVANGASSTAMGSNTAAYGIAATALGNGSVAAGLYSTAMGYGSYATGDISTAIGSAGLANGNYCIVIGESVVANSWISTTLGRHNDPIVTSPTYSWVPTEPLLIVGNGSGTLDKRNAMVILKNGNMGIGENAPANPLSFPNTFGEKILFSGTPSNHYGVAVQSNQLQMYSNGSVSDIAFGYNTAGIFTEKMRITGTGLVGIGESVPYTPLSFANVLGQKISLAGTASSHYGMAVQSGLMQIYSNGLSSDIAFGYFNGGFSEKMRIKGNGFVGIGNSNPSFILDVSGRMLLRSGGAVSNESGLWLNNYANQAQHFFIGMQNDEKVGFFGNNGIGWGFTMDRTTGNVSIASSLRVGSVECINGFCPTNGVLRLTPNLHLNAVAGSAAILNWDNGTGPIANQTFRVGNGSFADVFYVTYGGNAWLQGTLTQASDSRLKKEIHPLKNSLQKIIQINGYNYFWKKENADTSLQTGVLAQEVQKLFPDLVKEDKEGILSVNYTGLIPILIESVKEQQKQIDELKLLVKKILEK